MDRQALLNARSELTQAIRASEEWQPSYKRQPDTFKALLRHEAELQTQVAEYLVRIAERAPEYVDWSLVPEPLKAAANPLANKDAEAWELERQEFQKAVIEAITLLVATGAQFGEREYGIPLGISELSESVLKAAREQVAGLVTGVTETNRKLIQEAIKQSIARGEGAKATAERIRRVVSNPIRAEMIAQTESVNAYQTGLKNFAVETGAKTKTWEALVGACAVCSPFDGQTIDIEALFGGKFDRPAAHPRCRCGMIYNY